jgi:AcrR family transcriptional regulator
VATRLHVMPDGVKRARRYNSPLREEQAGQTRRRALAAARELFVAHGYAGTTVADVAKAAGVSPDTIYVSLGGKQGLLEGVWAMAIYDPDDPKQREQEQRLEGIARQSDPRQRLRRLVQVSCETLARTSPVHAVIRGAADGHPFAAELRSRLLSARLETQSRRLHAVLGSSLRAGISITKAAERYSALLSPELHHLLTVERQWTDRQYQAWIVELLEHDLLG